MNELDQAKELVRESVEAVLRNCGNSYINAYTQRWLQRAKDMGCYSGPLTGMIVHAIRSLEASDEATDDTKS